MMSRVDVDRVSKRYGQVIALDQITLTFADGEFFGLLGPSGSGKTTLLRAIAGFVIPDQGTIAFDGEQVESVPVHRRGIGMVFQNYALFPHLTVADNIGFGLDVRHVDRSERDRRLHELLGLVRLAGYGGRRPRELSGGQQQRVALARALATRPRVLLLDEPLGALDRKLRQEMQVELREIQRETGVTTIFVTHDQEEALEVADRVVLMNKGKVEQVDTPENVYEHPASPFVYGFLGTVNVFHGRAHDGVVDLGQVSLDAPEHSEARNAPAVVYARPHEIEIDRYSPGLPGIQVQLTRLLVVGPTARLELERADGSEIIEAQLPAERVRNLNLILGETLLIRPSKMHVFLDGKDSARAVDPQRPSPPKREESLPAFGTVIW
jgi:sulfate transport system ATP-binding protein